MDIKTGRQWPESIRNGGSQGPERTVVLEKENSIYYYY
jgi:hypothetical protein